MAGKEAELLKWNNPIRSYESLTVLRMMRSYQWLFQGKIYPTDVLRYHADLKDIEGELKAIEKYKEKKLEMGEKNKKVKDANR